MDNDKIIVEESIIYGKIIRSKSFFVRLIDGFYMSMIIGIYPTLAVININRNGITIQSLLILLLAATFSLAVLYAVLNLRNLQEFEGKTTEHNRNVLRKILKELRWKIIDDNEEILIGHKKWDWFSFDWGKEVVIIYSGKNLLINCICYGKHDLKSPFHWFHCRKIERKIIEEFHLELDKLEKQIQVNDR